MDNKIIYYQRLKTFEERFWEKVEGRFSDGCWIWTGSKRNGYGRMFDGSIGKNISAHRISWKIEHGEYPENNIKVLHKCDNPSCVNPSHLFLGTQQDNMNDMIKKGRHRYPIGEKVHTRKLNEKDVVEIRKLSSDLSLGALAEMYKVSKSAIKHLLRGRSWSWLQ